MQQSQQTMLVLGLAAGALVLAALVAVRLNSTLRHNEMVLKSVERSLARDARMISGAADTMPQSLGKRREFLDADVDAGAGAGAESESDDDDAASEVSFLEPSEIVTRKKRKVKNSA